MVDPIGVDEHTETAPTYDVAISFLDQDQELALRLRSKLSGLRVFVYSKEQESLAGSDGAEKFRSVFLDDCRLRVVLFRKGWGESRFTRVEESAIVDACTENGWDHLLFVQLEHGKALPVWLPKTHTRLSLVNYSEVELCGAIKNRVQELGAEIHPPSAADLARASADDASFERETDNCLRSIEGTKEAEAYVRRILAELEKAVNASTDAGRGMLCGGNVMRFVMRDNYASMTLDWSYYANSVADTTPVFMFWKGGIEIPGEQGRYFRNPQERGRLAFTITRTRGLGICFQERGRRDYLTAEAVAHKVMQRFLEVSSQAYEGRFDDFD